MSLAQCVCLLKSLLLNSYGRACFSFLLLSFYHRACFSFLRLSFYHSACFSFLRLNSYRRSCCSSLQLSPYSRAYFFTGFSGRAVSHSPCLFCSLPQSPCRIACVLLVLFGRGLLAKHGSAIYSKRPKPFIDHRPVQPLPPDGTEIS